MSPRRRNYCVVEHGCPFSCYFRENYETICGVILSPQQTCPMAERVVCCVSSLKPGSQPLYLSTPHETSTYIVNGKRVVGPKDIKNYWGDRHMHDLYRMTLALSQGLFPDANSAIDVGCYTSALLCEMDWIERRVASDIQPGLVSNWAGVPGVEFHPENAFEIEFPEPFDLVISNQTVEHLDQPADFILKLLDLGRGLIVSTTYEVAAGTIDGHVQDPISLGKFMSWFPCELDAWLICHHPTARNLRHIVGVVKQSHPKHVER